jgi:hypothetical protein
MRAFKALWRAVRGPLGKLAKRELERQIDKRVQAAGAEEGWYCRRCREWVEDGRCGCVTSPSPWEPRGRAGDMAQSDER